MKWFIARLIVFGVVGLALPYTLGPGLFKFAVLTNIVMVWSDLWKYGTSRIWWVLEDLLAGWAVFLWMFTNAVYHTVHVEKQIRKIKKRLDRNGLEKLNNDIQNVFGINRNIKGVTFIDDVVIMYFDSDIPGSVEEKIRNYIKQYFGIDNLHIMLAVRPQKL